MPSQVDEATASRIVEHNRRLHNDADYAANYDCTCGILAHPWERRVFERDVDAISTLVESGSARRVLDVGCGTGSLTLLFLERGFSVVSLDVAEAMLGVLEEHARARGFAHRLQTVADEADRFLQSSADSFDAVVFSAILHHLPDYLRTLRLGAARVRPGGLLYIIHEPSLAARVSLAARALERVDSGLAEFPAFLRRQWRDCRERGFSAAVLGKLLRRVRGSARRSCPAAPAGNATGPAADWALVDYHSKHGGCDEQAIAATLAELGFSVDLQLYDSKRHRILHLVARMLRTKRMIRILARRAI